MTEPAATIGPIGHDASECPILSRHWPGVAEELAARHRRQRLIERLHSLGPRPTGELLLELARAHGIESDIDRRLQRYAELDPGIVRALGADRFATLPLYEVSGGTP